VFTYAVLKLVEQGKLGLDVPLTTYLPKPFIAGDERLAKITARIVMSHRTGFPNWPADDGSVSIYFTPGERFSYSGQGYIYLQRVVEQITGKSLNQYMTEAVFTPLGMTSSSYVRRPDFDALTATGYDSDGKPTELWKPTEAGAASTLNTGSSRQLCARWNRCALALRRQRFIQGFRDGRAENEARCGDVRKQREWTGGKPLVDEVTGRVGARWLSNGSSKTVTVAFRLALLKKFGKSDVYDFFEEVDFRRARFCR
jgi:hypothetical protein